MTEEVVRWRFELQLRSSNDWWIAFTNPTAGPWKRLMGINPTGKEGEVYRFPRDDDRPDVVAVNDFRQMLLIVEAKDTAPRLRIPEQVRKSTAVVTSLSRELASLESHPFWGQRAKYQVIAGLLWGHPFSSDVIDVASLFELYRVGLGMVPLVGYETVQNEDGNLSIKEHFDKTHRSVGVLLP